MTKDMNRDIQADDEKKNDGSAHTDIQKGGGKENEEGKE